MNKKVTELNKASEINSDDLIMIIQNGENKKAEVSEIYEGFYSEDTIESYITLNETYGVKYRKIRNDIEINMKINPSITLDASSLTTIGTLETKYRPTENIFIPIFGVTSANVGTSTLRLLIMIDGSVVIQNLGNSAVTVSYASTFIKYSAL